MSAACRRSLRAALTEKILRQQRDIGRAFAQGRQVDRKDAETVVQVRTEAAGGRGRFEILIRGGDDPHVDGHGRRTADTLHLAVLQDPQELRLCLWRQVANFVEEQRASMRNLELAGLARNGAR